MSNGMENLKYFDKFGSILGLERITKLLESLDNPQKELRIIHVAGTNGKGSTGRFIYQSLLENGYSVGIYTSPFLEVFNERIEVDGKYISDDELAELSDKVTKQALEMEMRGLPVPTEFDIITSMAFIYFKEKKVDFVVLEVGLGGRADSTNAINNPIATVITSIGYDHTDRLGESLAQIAFEKAGIIKEKVPVICGRMPYEAMNVVERVAAENSSTLVKCQKYFESIKLYEKSLKGSSFYLENTLGIDENISISMIGEHQVENCIVAVKTLEMLREAGVKLNKERILSGLLKAKNKGRFEVVRGFRKEQQVILDGAHNEGGIISLDREIRNLDINDKAVLICGFLKDKDVFKMTDMLQKLCDDKKIDIIATEPNTDRKLSKEKLAALFREKGIEPQMTLSIEEILSDRGRYIKDYHTIIFAGSLYLIGDVRKGICTGGGVQL